MVEAVFFDIDGTLASFNTHKIPNSTKESIRLLKEKGIKVFVATGRGKHELSILDGLTFDGYITMNGQCCFDDKGNIIYDNAIDSKSVNDIFDYCNERSIPCSFTNGVFAHYNMVNDSVVEMHGLIHTPIGEVKDKTFILSHSIYQISAFLNNAQEMEFNKLIPDCKTSRWCSLFCDVSPKGGSKDKGIHRFSEYYKFNLDKTVAFGDGGNDLEMLKMVNLSIGMGNANDEVKEVVDYITDSVDDNGIYNALKHFNII